jgi:hypothetical protein
MFKSLGNIVANADVGLLFIAMHDKPRRLRVNRAGRTGEPSVDFTRYSASGQAFTR